MVDVADKSYQIWVWRWKKSLNGRLEIICKEED
jgi:hypothetical protein